MLKTSISVRETSLLRTCLTSSRTRDCGAREQVLGDVVDLLYTLCL
jgi:hypothetical protein